MVRRSRHHGVVGQSLAQRGLCDLDGDEGRGAVLSAMAKLAERLRGEAVRHGARRPSHPIQQPIANESEAMIAFDAITYNKGQALIRMLENYLGEAAFRDGIRAYMAAHAYGNTTTADLWRALERAGHKPVTEIAASFTEQDGVPLISAETLCSGDAQRLTMRQGRFVVAPARTAALPPRNWQIPVAVGKVAMAQSADVVLLNGSTEVPAGSCGEAIKVNL